MDRRSVLGLALAGASLASGVEAAEAPGVSTQTTGDGAHRYAQALVDIQRYGALHRSAHALPGLTLALTDRDGFTSLMRFGMANLERREPVRADHLFQIGSISKSFTALCIHRLIERGTLGLDTDVQTVLPEIPWPGGTRITIQSLLNHGSGLPDDAPAFPRGGDQRLWRGYETGTHWSYSNLGYELLGQMLARLHGRPYPEVVKAEILDPLGMRETRAAILTGDRARYAAGYWPYYDDRAYPQAGPLGPGPWVSMTEASGSVASTGADMAIYARYLMAVGAGHGAPLLSDAAAARFSAPTIEAPDWPGPGAKYANGLAVVRVGDHTLLHHTGGMLTFSSSIHVDPTSGVAAFASTNMGGAGYRPRDLTAFACERLRAALDQQPAPKPKPVQPPAISSSEFTGRYVSKTGRAFDVRIVSGALMAQTWNAVIGLEAADEDVFIAKDPASTPDAFVFRRSEKNVRRVWWGETEFVRDDARFNVTFTAPTLPQVKALTGRYVCDDPWRGQVRILAQGEALFVDGAAPVVALGDGLYRVGEKEWSPDRLSFDAFENGRPHRLVYSGVDYLRRDA